MILAVLKCRKLEGFGYPLRLELRDFCGVVLVIPSARAEAKTFAARVSVEGGALRPC